ncbi:MAG: pyridoxal phosphate-dependent aminotransferase family protein [Parachlamydia sp.]|nr:pyridoxal phosphate-dependent aminotransferase family protein [Parachlamydia sp.]
MTTSLLENQLLKRKRMGNLRTLPKQHPLIDFASNDYLGLARSSEMADAVMWEWKKRSGHLNGLGSTGSRLLTGNAAYAQKLEERLAAFHGFETATLFNCGYMANIGLHSAIASDDSIFIFDAHVHASVRDGLRLSRARSFPFRHNDLDHLHIRLKSLSAKGRCFITIASLYSTDGSQAPLRAISDLAQQYGALLIVDEAHAIGALGPSGRGLVAEQRINAKIFALIVTFGKALGTSGAMILGSSLLQKTLHNFARTYIYTTALPLINLAAIACSYDRFPLMDHARGHLRHLCARFGSFSPIHAIPVKGNAAAKEKAFHLSQAGFDVSALLSPTIRQGHEALRVCLHAFNTDEQVSRLQNCLWRMR